MCGLAIVNVGPHDLLLSGLVYGAEGFAQTLTITARDEDGSTITGYQGNFLVRSSDARAVLYGSLASSWIALFGSFWFQNGVAHLPLTLHSFGSQSLVAFDLGAPYLDSAAATQPAGAISGGVSV